MGRTIALYAMLLAGLLALTWALWFQPLPPADFAFSNSSEIKSVDPAVVSGQPEGRIIRALYEGLCDWDPETCLPIPGVAESWELSEDGKTYTFHLREDARWSNGEPVTAEDFRYSFRRFLHPATGAQYAAEFWYVVGAKDFTSMNFEPGQPVEIELDTAPPADKPGAPGTILHGTLVEVEEQQKEGEDEAEKVYVVEIDGRQRRFQKKPTVKGVEAARWVLPDFDQTVGVRVVGDRTLEITLNDRTPYFVELMGFYPFFPVNRECIERHGDAWTKPENLVCNGPFTLEFRRLRDRIRLRKNPYYWDAENVACETIDALAVESYPTNLNLYMTGQVDWIPAVPPEIIPDLLEREDKDFAPSPFLATYYYVFNTEKPPFDDPRVRRALTMALERQEIVDTVTRAGQVPTMGLVPPIISKSIDYTPPQGEPENVEKAKALLAEAGYPGGEGFPRAAILYNTAETHEAIAEMIQHQWKRNLGIDVELTNQEWSAYLESREQGKFHVARAGWTGDYLDPVTFLNLCQSEDPNNHTRWKNADFDRLLAEAAQEADPAKRFDLLEQAEQIVVDEMPVLPIYSYVDPNMVRPYVKGWYRNLRDTHPLKSIRIDQEEKKRIFERDGLLYVPPVDE